jgi:LmbE family N-acetylglucosaminyl deacetylase
MEHNQKPAKKLMVVGAHADDIELNVGGALAKYAEAGYGVVYVMATDNSAGACSVKDAAGNVTVKKLEPAEQMKIRKEEAEAGAAFFGTTAIHLDHPQRHFNRADGSLAELRFGGDVPATAPSDVPTILTAHEDPASVAKLVELMVKHNPEYIVTHGLDQTDMEHYGTLLLTTKSYWKAVDEHGLQAGLLYWLMGKRLHGKRSMQWDTYIDISAHLDAKMESVALHACQVPNALAPDAGARLRAMAYGTACGCGAAEVFNIINPVGVSPMARGLYPTFAWEIVSNAK